MENPLADGGQRETLGLLKFPKTREAGLQYTWAFPALCALRPQVSTASLRSWCGLGALQDTLPHTGLRRLSSPPCIPFASSHRCTLPRTIQPREHTRWLNTGWSPSVCGYMPNAHTHMHTHMPVCLQTEMPEETAVKLTGLHRQPTQGSRNTN